MNVLAPAAPFALHDYREPGGLIHLDIKKPGRFERGGQCIPPRMACRAIHCHARGYALAIANPTT